MAIQKNLKVRPGLDRLYRSPCSLSWQGTESNVLSPNNRDEALSTDVGRHFHWAHAMANGTDRHTVRQISRIPTAAEH
ncbi:hypothetical protein QTP88_005777 [Uroleucon formosanum]